MAKMVDISGQRFGRLTVLHVEGKYRSAISWKCLCDCGKQTTVNGVSLRNGNTKSCGCLQRDRRITHGNSSHPLWKVWSNMLQRCNNPSSISYKNYGLRGIRVCQEWLNFDAFLEDMYASYQPGLQLDRIDNDGNYCKENCRWSTVTENLRNTRGNRKITYKGATKTISEWAESEGYNYQTLYARLARGWSVDEAFETRTNRRSI